jgi:hypothetical protein
MEGEEEGREGMVEVVKRNHYPSYSLSFREADVNVLDPWM